MTEHREPGFYWVRGEDGAWTVVQWYADQHGSGEWGEACGYDGPIRDDDVAEWGPRIKAPDEKSVHPVDALKDCFAQLGETLPPEREAEMRAYCDAPCEIVPTAELEALRAVVDSLRAVPLIPVLGQSHAKLADLTRTVEAIERLKAVGDTEYLYGTSGAPIGHSRTE